MNEFAVREYTEEDYKEFFEWLLERDVHMNHMIDVTLLDTHKEPKVYYPDEIKSLLETAAMQRLKRVTQLGSSLFGNEEAFQTRLAHSIGAGNNAQKFYIKLFKENPEWKNAIEKYGKKEEILADIIHMYVHDIGHNVLSHTLESLIKSNEENNQICASHEILGKRIVNEDSEIIEVFSSISQTFLKTFNKVTSPEYDLKSIKDGAVDFDRLDYLIRDELYDSGYEDRDITEKLIENYDLVLQYVNGQLKQIPVLKVDSKRDIRDFLERRKKGYQDNYWTNYSVALSKLAIYFCNKIAEGNFECDLKKYIVDCIQNGGNGIDLEEFKAWDDARFYNEVIKIAKNHPDNDMKEFATMILPSLRGLTNFVFEAYDLDHIKSEDELRDAQKEFYTVVKDLVKKDSPLHRRLLSKKGDEIVFLDSENAEDRQKVLDELEQTGITENKLNSLISWDKTIRIYNAKDPIYLKNSREEVLPLDAYIVFSDERDNKEVNGVLALPIQMKENGFSDEEIKLVHEKFRSYNREHRKEKTEIDSCLSDVIECANNLIEEDEVEL